jgi:hypothetical protein
MKLKRTILSLVLAGGVLAGQAAMATGPSATGPAKYGLCMAYFSGQGGENGRKNDAPPFKNLAEAAGVASGDTQDQANQKIADFCDDARPGNGSEDGHSKAPAPGH